MQFFAQPRHGSQWALGEVTRACWPYIRCTGSSGHMVEHHPDLPFSSTPPANAATSATSSAAAVAGPEVLSSHLRLVAPRKNSVMAIRNPCSATHAGAVRARENPNSRGVWLAAASGHRLRQMPGAMTHRAGRSGTASPKKISSPRSGTTTSSPISTRPSANTPSRMARQRSTLIRRGIWV